MGKTTTLVKSLRRFGQSLWPEYSLQAMYLFGSRATGKERKDSDVDLLLVSPVFRRQRRLRRAPPLYLRWDLDYPVDFICLTPEEFQRKKKEIGIVQEAVKAGIKIL